MKEPSEYYESLQNDRALYNSIDPLVNLLRSTPQDQTQINPRERSAHWNCADLLHRTAQAPGFNDFGAISGGRRGQHVDDMAREMLTRKSADEIDDIAGDDHTQTSSSSLHSSRPLTRPSMPSDAILGEQNEDIESRSYRATSPANSVPRNQITRVSCQFDGLAHSPARMLGVVPPTGLDRRFILDYQAGLQPGLRDCFNPSSQSHGGQVTRPRIPTISTSPNNPDYYAEIGTAFHLMLDGSRRQQQQRSLMDSIHRAYSNNPHPVGTIDSVLSNLRHCASLTQTYMQATANPNLTAMEATFLNSNLSAQPNVANGRWMSSKQCPVGEQSELLSGSRRSPAERWPDSLTTNPLRESPMRTTACVHSIANDIISSASTLGDADTSSSRQSREINSLTTTLLSTVNKDASGIVVVEDYNDTQLLSPKKNVHDGRDHVTTPASDSSHKSDNSGIAMEIVDEQCVGRRKLSIASISACDAEDVADKRSLNESQCTGKAAKNSSSSSSSSSSNSRIRTAYNSMQILNLEREFAGNMYLSRIRRIELSQKLRLSEKQVKIWFQNRRVKYKKENLLRGPQELAQQQHRGDAHLTSSNSDRAQSSL